MFILIPTVVNNSMEIKNRITTKPEFTKFLNSIEESRFKNLSVYAPVRELKLVINYIKSLDAFKKNSFKIYNMNNIPDNENMIWVICYKPLVGFDCTLPNNKENKWDLKNTKKNHLLNSRLFKIN